MNFDWNTDLCMIKVNSNTIYTSNKQHEARFICDSTQNQFVVETQR